MQSKERLIYRTAIRKNKDLLKAAKRVFGDELVINAWITTLDAGFEPDYVRSRLDEETSNVQPGKSELRYDAQNIVIEFCNGRKVLFTNSEWASMELTKDELIYEA